MNRLNFSTLPYPYSYTLRAPVSPLIEYVFSRCTRFIANIPPSLLFIPSNFITNILLTNHFHYCRHLFTLFMFFMFCSFFYGGRSSVGRALVCGTSGRGFESRRSPHAFDITPPLDQTRSELAPNFSVLCNNFTRLNCNLRL